jgi:hypothetical protein
VLVSCSRFHYNSIIFDAVEGGGCMDFSDGYLNNAAMSAMSVCLCEMEKRHLCTCMYVDDVI